MVKKLLKYFFCVALFAVCIVGLNSCKSSKLANQNYIQDVDETPLEEMNFEDTFDFYEIVSNNELYGINAYNYVSSDSLENVIDVSYNEEENVRVAYSIEFSYQNMQVNMLTTVFDGGNNLLYSEECVGNPIFYDDGGYDVVFVQNDIEVYLSDIIEEQDSCFFFTLFISSALAAKIVAACIVVAKVTAVVVGTVVVLGVTYELVNVTRDFINEKIKEAEVEKRKKDKPEIYRNARVNGSGKLIISATAVDIDKATAGMRASQSYWTPLYNDAKNLCVNASGGFCGPEIDRTYDGKAMVGHYWHFHCLNRAYNVHCWYGTPYAQVY
mgnify:CR=1 FL=1